MVFTAYCTFFHLICWYKLDQLYPSTIFFYCNVDDFPVNVPFGIIFLKTYFPLFSSRSIKSCMVWTTSPLYSSLLWPLDCGHIYIRTATVHIFPSVVFVSVADITTFGLSQEQASHGCEGLLKYHYSSPFSNMSILPARHNIQHVVLYF